MEKECSRGDLHTEIPLKNYKPGQWPNLLEAIQLIFPTSKAHFLIVHIYTSIYIHFEM